ncbi:MAG: hypothetical protein KDK34_07875 [Leptospiraceae bacterium]|nr:hypothetical protein [Leptospiraceae bacterium]
MQWQLIAYWHRFRRGPESWGILEWAPTALLIQFLIVLLYQIAVWLWPTTETPPPAIDLTTDMQFIEFQEPAEDTPVQSTDLSDEIVETDSTQDKVNWNNARDPRTDFDQRYLALLDWSTSDDDYPSSARRSNLGKVTVLVTLYISAGGKIRDVRVRGITSSTGGHEAFQTDFAQAARDVFLNKARLKNNPYSVNGVPQDFVWNTHITFTLN